VEAGGDLAGGEETFHVGGVALGLHHHASHGVVGRGRDLHRVPGDVEHLVLEDLAVQPGQLGQDVALAAMGDAEEDAVVGAAAALEDLGVVARATRSRVDSSMRSGS